jgi:hypothetical protein
MPRPLRRIARAALAVGIGATAIVGANHTIKSRVNSFAVDEFEMPDNYECNEKGCAPKQVQSKRINRITRLVVREPKIQSEQYKFGKTASEKTLIDKLKKTGDPNLRYDLIAGFCFRFYEADEDGGHFNYNEMNRLIKNPDLKKRLVAFMQGFKKN